jgi:hypothetical protein
MSAATCPKCKALFSFGDGKSPICPGCGARFKVPAAKPELAAVAAFSDDQEPERLGYVEHRKDASNRSMRPLQYKITEKL